MADAAVLPATGEHPATLPHAPHELLPSHESRRIPKRFPALDGLRGFAVLAVFLYHYGEGRHSQLFVIRAFGNACSLGWAGVMLFFLLSGFLITGLLWDAKGEAHWLRNFYLRRALRIWPLYYGTLLLLLLWPLFDHRYSLRGLATVAWIHALFLQTVPHLNWLFKQVPSPFWLEHYWTLAVEEQFYLFWPLLLFIIRTRRQAFVLCLLTVALCYGFQLRVQQASHNPAEWWHSLPWHAGELALGGALALAFRDPCWPLFKRCVCWSAGLSAVVLLAVSFHLASSARELVFANTWGVPVATVAFAGLLSVVLEPGWMERLWRARWLRWLGQLSYGIYVFHLLLIWQCNALIARITGRPEGTAVFGVTRFVVVATLTVTLAWLSFHFYEKPFLRLKLRFAAHPSRPAGVA